MPAVKEEDLIEFDWLQLRNDMNKMAPTETRQEKLFRKIKENPFVPVGVVATTAALCTGLWSFKVGNRQLSQYMMRARIAAQGFTVLAACRDWNGGLAAEVVDRSIVNCK